MIAKFGHWWAGIICRFAPWVLVAGLIVTVCANFALSRLNVSTQIEALMPSGAKSVQTLHKALKKTGSFASIQIVATGNEPEQVLSFIKAVKTEIDRKDWVDQSQYSEDVSVIEQHKLMLLDTDELLELETDLHRTYPYLIAKQVSDVLGNHVTFTLRSEGITRSSREEVDLSQFEDLKGEAETQPQSERLFQSDDKKTIVLVVWPKPGYDSLGDSKRLVDDSHAIVNELNNALIYRDIRTGVAGRIANKVAQFDAIVRDLSFGLLTSVFLIMLLLFGAYRSWTAIPLMLIPLALGIFWTLGLTAITIGSLNLITVFLTLILFGLGIDFAIHNMSRFTESLSDGLNLEDSIHTVIVHTGGASLVAALTTSCAFFSLMFTQFRAFTEFGFIAGSGILLTFIAMYTLLPAGLVLATRAGWSPRMRRVYKAKSIPNWLNPLRRPGLALGVIATLCVFIALFAPQIQFERNIKNLEAKRPVELALATQEVGRVFTDGHDRAIVVVDNHDDLVATAKHFRQIIREDKDTPSVRKVQSLLNFVPDQKSQEERLRIINRIDKRADELSGLDENLYQSSQTYLSISDINEADIPPALRRTFLGIDGEEGYLLYVYNSVNMNDSVLARQFYNDAYKIDLGDKTYYSAAEGFIFVEMIAMMKLDAIKAILLVTLTTFILIWVFLRHLRGTLITLTPPLIGMGVTIAVMGAFGPDLSIMNMVILPSLIGIAVDNTVHIYHRFESEGHDTTIPEVMATTGKAAALTTATTMVGFGGMVTASMGGLRSMGLLALIGFSACLIVTWILLPLLMQYFGGLKLSPSPIAQPSKMKDH